MNGLLAIILTFFFQFIGTFISRLFFAKQPIASVLIATILHALALLLLFIPVLGWIIYVIVELFFIYKNYKLSNK